MILASSIVGSGELIATTTVGAEAGFILLWLIVIGCAIKVAAQVEIGRHTLSWGHTPLAAFDRVPGPRLGGRPFLDTHDLRGAILAREVWVAFAPGFVSKAALASFSRCLAEEERQHGVNVSTLTLGSVNTPLWDSETVHSSFDRRAMLAPEQVADAVLYLAQQPYTQTVEDLTLMPAAGAF
jgi:NAD(P)-dependent dehydrogenase (short-subunit alcohol dehydrogenase family)